MSEEELIQLIQSRTKAPGKAHYKMSKTISPGRPEFIKVTKRKIKRKKSYEKSN